MYLHDASHTLLILVLRSEPNDSFRQWVGLVPAVFTAGGGAFKPTAKLVPAVLFWCSPIVRSLRLGCSTDVVGERDEAVKFPRRAASFHHAPHNHDASEVTHKRLVFTFGILVEDAAVPPVGSIFHAWKGRLWYRKSPQNGCAPHTHIEYWGDKFIGSAQYNNCSR